MDNTMYTGLNSFPGSEFRGGKERLNIQQVETQGDPKRFLLIAVFTCMNYCNLFLQALSANVSIPTTSSLEYSWSTTKDMSKILDLTNTWVEFLLNLKGTEQDSCSTPKDLSRILARLLRHRVRFLLNSQGSEQNSCSTLKDRKKSWSTPKQMSIILAKLLNTWAKFLLNFKGLSKILAQLQRPRPLVKSNEQNSRSATKDLSRIRPHTLSHPLVKLNATWSGETCKW